MAPSTETNGKKKNKPFYKVDSDALPLVEISKRNQKVLLFSVVQHIHIIQPQHSCVVLVGTTGTGKTSCLNIYTGNNLPTGESPVGVTKETVCVEDLIHKDGPRWLDNPGWSDAEGRSDSGIFKSLLRNCSCYFLIP